MALVADELEDLQVNGDREVYVDGTGDLATTSGIDTVKQSVMLNAGAVLRPLIGEPADSQTIEDAQEKLRRVLARDPQIEAVRRVEVTEINERDRSVSVRVFVANNNDFEIGVDV